MKKAIIERAIWIAVVAIILAENVASGEIAGDTIELKVAIKPSAARQFGVQVYCDRDGNGGFPITVEPENKTLAIGDMKVPFELKTDENLELRVFLDKNMIEVFANDRQAAVAPHKYAPENLGVSIFSKGRDVVRGNSDSSLLQLGKESLYGST